MYIFTVMKPDNENYKRNKSSYVSMVSFIYKISVNFKTERENWRNILEIL